jgi:hypothetical protein
MRAAIYIFLAFIGLAILAMQGVQRDRRTRARARAASHTRSGGRTSRAATTRYPSEGYLYA